jgi:hypothetical protein
MLEAHLRIPAKKLCPSPEVKPLSLTEYDV